MYAIVCTCPHDRELHSGGGRHIYVPYANFQSSPTVRKCVIMSQRTLAPRHHHTTHSCTDADASPVAGCRSISVWCAGFPPFGRAMRSSQLQLNLRTRCAFDWSDPFGTVRCQLQRIGALLCARAIEAPNGFIAQSRACVCVCLCMGTLVFSSADQLAARRALCQRHTSTIDRAICACGLTCARVCA